MTEPATQPAPPKALPPGVFPPESVELDGFRLRRPTPADDTALHEAVKAGFTELHQWMPWAKDPADIAEQRAWLERSAENWTTQAAYNYLIVDVDDTVLGSISIMDRIGPRALEIGYWLRTDATGRGLITRAAAWATDTALALPGIDRVEIKCDAANHRSAAVPQRLGYRLDREFPEEPGAPGDSGVTQVWIKP